MSHAPRSVQIIRDQLFAHNPVAGRLISDQRLRHTWRYLSAATVVSLESAEGWQLATTYADAETFTTSDLAAGVVFAHTVMELSTNRAVVLSPDVKSHIAEWRHVAQQCRNALAGEMPDPYMDETMRRALEIVAVYFDKQATWYDTISGEKPYRLPQTSKQRSDNDDPDAANLMRGRARSISQKNLAIYGNKQYGTVAKLLTVGLGLLDADEVTEIQVQKWTASP